MPNREQQPRILSPGNKPPVSERRVFHAWLTRTGHVPPGTAQRLWHKATAQFDVYTVVTQFLTNTEFEKWQAFRNAATEYFGERFVPDPRIKEQGTEKRPDEKTIRCNRRYWYVE